MIVLTNIFNNENGDVAVSVIVATRDRSHYLRDLIRSLLYQEFKNFELVIVDDSRNKYHREKVAELAEEISGKLDVVLLRNEYGMGIPESLNRGVAVASGSIIAFTDDDCIADSRWLSNIVRWYRYPNVGGVGGKVIPIEIDAVWSAREVKGHEEVGKISWNGEVVSNFDLGKHVTLVDCLPGANMSFRKDLVIKAGGFSPIYKGNAYRFETELSYRVRRLNYKIVYDPGAIILHRRASHGGARVDVYSWNYWFVRNHILFVLRNLEGRVGKVAFFMFKQIIRILMRKRMCPYAEPERWHEVLHMVLKGMCSGIIDYIVQRDDAVLRFKDLLFSARIKDVELEEGIEVKDKKRDITVK